jgi:WD40 repeat protein
MYDNYFYSLKDLDFSPRNILASASIDNRILLWDLNNARVIIILTFRFFFFYLSFVLHHCIIHVIIIHFLQYHSSQL